MTKTKNKPLAQEKHEAEIKDVAQKLEKLLVEHKFAIQPFLSVGENGVLPNVRLVKVNDTDNRGDDDTSDAKEETKQGETK